MTEKITLRSKADPSIVLPEGELIHESNGRWAVRLAPATEDNTFSMTDWEPVPPPYELPTKPGAVVTFAGGYAILADDDANPWRVILKSGGYLWVGGKELLTKTGLVTLSEGVDL